MRKKTEHNFRFCLSRLRKTEIKGQLEKIRSKKKEPKRPLINKPVKREKSQSYLTENPNCQRENLS